MRREDGCRQFLMHRGKRCMSSMIGGAFQRPYRHIMPIAVSGRDRLAEVVGVRGGELLLSDTTPGQSRMIEGTGYGVKTPSNNLLKKLDNLSVGTFKKVRKNINMEL